MTTIVSATEILVPVEPLLIGAQPATGRVRFAAAAFTSGNRSSRTVEPSFCSPHAASVCHTHGSVSCNLQSLTVASLVARASRIRCRRREGRQCAMTRPAPPPKLRKVDPEISRGSGSLGSPGRDRREMDAIYFESPGVARLQVLLDEVTRAKPGAPETRFVQAEGGLIDRLESRFHHVLYGRRGTGKSSLLG